MLNQYIPLNFADNFFYSILSHRDVKQIRGIRARMRNFAVNCKYRRHDWRKR